MGIITRLACGRAKQEGVDAKALLRKAGLRHQQIDDPRARIAVKAQISFLRLPPTRSTMTVLASISRKNSISASPACFTT
jgi:hypothetical protein